VNYLLVLLPEVGTEEAALNVAEKIRAAMVAPIDADGYTLTTSASIGVAIFPFHGLNATDLMNNADTAMYAAKTNGRNTVVIYGEHTVKITLKDLI
jgi:diguanylate cyclase (GGDEF)-like protein